jgi:hypothetical protein
MNTQNVRTGSASKNEKLEKRISRSKKTQKTRDGRRGLLYTSDGAAARAFLSLRSLQARTSLVGQAAFAYRKPRFFRPSRPQNPPVLRERKRLVLPVHKPLSPPPTVQGVTHYTLQGKVVCQMERCPLWKPLPRNPGFIGCFQPAGSFPSGLLL